jgi:predicted nucleic acid-binding protein
VRTALDTNIISTLWSNEPAAASIAKLLSDARQDGAILVSGVVYCELLAYPRASEAYVNNFFAETGITIDLHLQDSVWLEAGRRFANYADRRRKSKAESPKRLLADFLVGAHALIHADRLMTLDDGRYLQDFPELHLYRPRPSASPEW